MRGLRRATQLPKKSLTPANYQSQFNHSLPKAAYRCQSLQSPSRLCFASSSRLKTSQFRHLGVSRQIFAASHAVAEQETLPKSQASVVSAHRGEKLQNCDYSVLRGCVSELKKSFVPSKIDQVIQSSASTVNLLLRNQDALENNAPKQWLYLCWHNVQGRICTGPSPDRGAAAEAYSLADQLKSAIIGGILLDITMPLEWERVVDIQIGPRLGECTHHIYLETMANLSNLILTGSDGRIISCGRQVSGKMSRHRTLQTGSKYKLPPAQTGRVPSSTETFEEWQEHLETLHEELEPQWDKRIPLASLMVKAYRGVSPVMASSILGIPGLHPDVHWVTTTDESRRKVHRSWVQALEGLEKGQLWPCTVEDSKGRPCLSVICTGDNAPVASPQQSSILELVDSYYRVPQEDDTFGKLFSRVQNAVKKGRKSREQKQGTLEKQVAEADQADNVQKEGDLIIANLYKYQEGSNSLEVDDWDSGEARTIQLDPLKSGNEQAQAYFKRAAKLRRTAGHVLPLIQQTKEELEVLGEVDAQLNDLDPKDSEDLRALREIEEELVKLKYLKPSSDAALGSKGQAKARKASKRAKISGSKFRQFEAPSGLQILVGRNNVQNDELSNSVANASDLWFHVKSLPGSHTVLRIPDGRVADAKDVQAAANLAAFFSKAQNENKAEVIYTFAKYLKKPRGARPGQVLVSNEQSIVAMPARSLAAGINE